MGSTRYFGITRKKQFEKIETLSEALRMREEGGFIWIDITDPNIEDLTALAEPLELHPLAIEDCLDEDQVPKMEEFPGHTFILFNRYQCGEGVAKIEEINFFLGQMFLVTVHPIGPAAAPLADRIEATVRRDLKDAGKGPDFLLQVILDEIVDEKFDAIETMQEQLDAIEDEVLEGNPDFQPGQLIHLRRDLLLLRKSLVYEREILVKICRRDTPFIGEDAIYDFRDIYDHLAKFFEVVEICRDLISSIMEIHLSMVNNHIAVVGNKTNHFMRRLTLITTVFMPLTLLAGVGGMSEWSMMTGSKNWPIAYPAFLAAMAVIGFVNYRVLKWVDSKDPQYMTGLHIPPEGRSSSDRS